MSFGFSAQEKKSLEKPNVLFLVIEDTSPYLLPAYGNQSIKTPNLDFLAKNGLIFNHAFANAPYCSPARSTLISGTLATVYGNDIHREGHFQPSQYFLPKILRDAGYFTVNKGKTDYNITGDRTREYMRAAWNRNEGKATYNDSLRAGRPFFAQFNNLSTHMSRMTTITIKNRLKCAVDPNEVELPPHVPDLPEVRADYALHLEGVQNIDEWVGLFIDDLKERQLLDNTIIFFFSDHGGCLPRGKAFPFDTGHRVPLIVYAPEQYEHLLPGKRGSRIDRMVSFDDFIPTVISISGASLPDYITGQPFMGHDQAPERKYIHTFRTNSSHHFNPSRAVFDDRYHYIKFYMPYKIHGLTQGFQWQMPAQLAWDQLFIDGKAKPEHRGYYLPSPVEALYDLQNDPWELDNLAEDEQYKDKLMELRETNAKYIRKIKDIGFLSRENRAELTRQGVDFYTWIRANDYPLEKLISLAEKASEGDPRHLELLIESMKSDRASFRYWGVTGCANLAKNGKLATIPEEVYRLTKDPHKDIAATAAEVLVLAGEVDKGLQLLISDFGPDTYALSSLENLWEKTAPLKEDFQSLAEELPTPRGRMYARSLLAKHGELTTDQLFEQETIDKQHKTYLNRVKNYLQNKPN